MWFEEFMHALQGNMSTPTWFGWFHLLWLGIMICECVVIFIFRKKISRKCINIILLVTGILLILFEVYKQLDFSFNYNGGNGNSYWQYQWYAFPFQFCSTPMYLMLLAGLLRKGRVYDALICYLATFSLFAGMVVMVYPGNVFISTIGINIQTMFWHSSMVVIGFLLLVTKSVQFNIKTFLKALIVFVIMIVLALIMNIIWHYCGDEQKFNMFYISPYIPCNLVVLDVVYASLPYPVFLLIYIIGFSLAGIIIIYFAKLCEFISQKIGQKRAGKIENENLGKEGE